jgi:hypothetical protein
MGIISNFFFRESVSPTAVDRIAESTALANYTIDLQEEHIKLKESYGLAQLRLEDYMWAPVAGWQPDDGFKIETIREEADHCRALYAINPLLKKAVTARIGMIHGRGARIVPASDKNYGGNKIERELERHKRKIFGNVARARLEGELSVAGNVWTMKVGSKEAVIVPIGQIIGYVTDTDDPSVVQFWKRSYSAVNTDVKTGTETPVNITEYIPTTAAPREIKSIGQVLVRTDAIMHHIAANRQEGWVLGLPDLFAAKFWAKGHKEMFEAGHEFTLAQGKIAAKVTGGNQFGSQLAASRLADEPRRDFETGEVHGYGGTAAMAGGLDYQLMGKMGGSVDFSSYDRIAGLIAAATGVPLKVLLADSGDEEVSLEQSVISDMKLRQDLWGEFYEDFLAPYTIITVWPRIKQETVYRVQQAVEIASRTNTLTAKEKRLLALEAFGLEGDYEATPKIEDHPDVQVYKAKKELDVKYAAKIAAASGKTSDNERSTTPDQGNDEGLGKLSDGEDAHEARDAGEQEHTR